MDLMESVKYTGYLIGGLTAAHFTYLTVGSLLERTGQRINSQEELDALVKKEAERLGLDKLGLPIIASLKKENGAIAYVGRVRKEDDGEFQLAPIEDADNPRNIKFGSVILMLLIK